MQHDTRLAVGLTSYVSVNLQLPEHMINKSNARAIDQENYRNDHKVEASTLILQNDCELIVSAKSRT